MNMMPLTMAAEVPICWGCTTSAAVLKASMCVALANPKIKHSAMASIAPSPADIQQGEEAHELYRRAKHDRQLAACG